MFLIPNVVQGRYFEGEISNRFGLPKYIGIPLTIGIQNPSSTDKESEIQKPQPGVQCPQLH